MTRFARTWGNGPLGLPCLRLWRHTGEWQLFTNEHNCKTWFWVYQSLF